MWDSWLYAQYAAQERMRELESDAQRISLERSVPPARPRGLGRRLISLGPHLDSPVSGPASASSRPGLAPGQPKTGEARASAGHDAHQWRKGVMRLVMAIGLARYLS